jgi:hypothetical protein
VATTEAIHQQGDKTIRTTLKAIVAAQQAWSHAHGVGAPPSVTETLAAIAPIAGLEPPHLVTDMLSQAVFYPAHDKRRETAGYRAARKRLVDQEDRPCLVCGVRSSTLTNKAQNPFGAKELETHHRIVEWALSNAVDLKKFNARIVGSLRRRNPADPTYGHDFTRQEMLDWIDHGLDNLWVLCDVHHRHKYVGIPAITYPIWGPQDILLPDFGAQIPD